ncbi:iron hydrogenase [Anaeramoeba ignava]|uniref:Iron hydrogenase n=1 Tax=Anaeramoeba ignava TaxID=1746090 RepID=A0A9Q0L7X9_ANAIG|nr:iron hydrogenase [Anaeramoeba ignava]
MDSSYQTLINEWKKIGCNVVQPIKTVNLRLEPKKVLLSQNDVILTKDNQVYQFDIQNESQIAKLKKHESKIKFILRQENTLITSDSEGLIVIWNLIEKRIQRLIKLTSSVTSMTIYKTTLFASSLTPSIIHQWDFKTGEKITQYEGHEKSINQIQFLPQKSTLYSCSDDGTVIAWSTSDQNKKIRLKFQGHYDPVVCFCIMEEKDLLFTGSKDLTVICWDMKNAQPIQKFYDFSSLTTKMIAEKNQVFIGFDDGTVIGIKPNRRKSFEVGVIITSSEDETIRIFSIDSKKSKILCEGHKSSVKTFSTSNEGNLVSIDADGEVFFWPVKILKAEKENKKKTKKTKTRTNEEIPKQEIEKSILSSKKLNEKVTVFIDGKQYQGDSNKSILEVCRENGIDIPSLCYHPRLHPLSTCKCCVVQIETTANCFRKACACATEIRDGMKIITNSNEIKGFQRNAILELRQKQRSRALTLKDESFDKSTEFGRLLTNVYDKFVDNSNGAISIDLSKCIDCARCAQVCDKIQGMSIISFPARSIGAIETVLRTKGNFLSESSCIACGQCSVFCPTDAISEFDQTSVLKQQIKLGDKRLVVGIAPSARVSIAEEFEMEPGAISVEKFVSALRMLGFDDVFDLQFTADLTIMEEGTELLKRLKDPNAVLPMFTSCCPAWINMVEKLYPFLIPHLSSVKSPQQIFGAIVKTFYAHKIKIDPQNIYCVTITPCTAKKQEIHREEMKSSGFQDVDLALTVREIGKMLREISINWESIKETSFDDPLGKSSGSGSLFASTGGVMEAAIRTAYEIETKKTFPKLVFQELRGLENIKQTTIEFEERNTKGLITFDFAEVMACPGGCLGGGGQPRSHINILPKRIQAVYDNEFSLPYRKSHTNKSIMKIYEKFLNEPMSEISRKLLHTKYRPNAHQSEVKQNSINMFKFVMEGLSEHNSVLVLFGSQTGTAEMAAIKITQILLESKIKARLFEMNNYPITNLSSEKFVILITSTFWEGSFPENAIQFWKDLQSFSFRLKNIKYSIFGLGNSTYTHFNHAGRLLDIQLKKLGAHCFLKMGEGDYQAPDG